MESFGLTMPPEESYFIQFFGFHVLATTIALAAIILGKDLFLERRKSKAWNIALAMLCGILLCWGWMSFLAVEMKWGIVR